MKYRYLSIFMFVAILAVFSFWPSVIDAHYSGLIFCPIISVGNMADCATMVSHMAKIISHIADFMIMIAFVLPIWVLAVFSVKAVTFHRFFKSINLILKNKIAFYADFQNFLISEIKTKISIFLALEKGILNTKIF